MRLTASEALLVNLTTDVATCASEARQSDLATVGQIPEDQAQLDVLVTGTWRVGAKRHGGQNDVQDPTQRGPE